MWDMSDPGSPAQHCFLRQPQLEYFTDGKRAEDSGLDAMPDVSGVVAFSERFDGS